MDRNARQCGFIGNKGPQLGERPAMECRTLRPFSPHPRANVRQIFQRYRPLCAFGLRDNPFREVVVYPGREAVFLPRQLLQAAAGTMGALSLELLSQAPLPIANVLNRLTRVDLPIVINGNVRYAHVNAKDALHIRGGGFLDIIHRKQVPRAVDQGEIGFPMLVRKQLPLALTAHKRDGLSPVQRPERDRGIRQRIGPDTVVIGDRPMRPECPAHPLIAFVGGAYLAQRSDRHLRGQSEGRAYRVIADLRQVELAKGLRGPSDAADVVARRVCCFEGSPERVGLYRRRKEFQLCGKFHYLIIPRIERLYKCALKRAQAGGVPPSAQAAGLPALKGKLS